MGLRSTKSIAGGADRALKNAINYIWKNEFEKLLVIANLAYGEDFLRGIDTHHIILCYVHALNSMMIATLTTVCHIDQ